MVKLTLVLFFSCILFVQESFSQGNTVTCDFKKELVIDYTTKGKSIFFIESNGKEYFLTSSEVVGIPAASKSDLVFIFKNNIDKLSKIEFVLKDAINIVIEIESDKSINIEKQWEKVIFYNKNGEKVGEQLFSKMF
jgi:hypothetical protein